MTSESSKAHLLNQDKLCLVTVLLFHSSFCLRRIAHKTRSNVHHLLELIVGVTMTCNKDRAILKICPAARLMVVDGPHLKRGCCHGLKLYRFPG